MSHTHLLIVHPDPSVRGLTSSMLQTMGYPLREAANDRVAVRMLEAEPASLVLAGADDDSDDAFEFLAYLRRKHPGVPVILFGSGIRPERLREALQRGASSVLRFPLPANHLRAAVAQALGEPESAPAKAADTSHHANGTKSAFHGSQVAANGHHAGNGGPAPTNGHHHAPPPQAGTPPALLGDDPCMRQAAELAETIAPSRAPVLILGERGAGKSLLARTLHARSPRRDGVLVELCGGALKEAALEAELFGRKGGFSEAERPGRLLQAHGGTLFLDEVDALSPALQFKLLRLIQDGEFEPVGSNATCRVDVRLVFGTTEDLSALVEQGRFRSDLFYRIGVVTLKLPPLRHRGGDVDRLAEHFRSRFARELRKDVVGFTDAALALLRGHDWPGNVLELENAVQRAVIRCRGGRIEPADLELGVGQPEPRGPRPPSAHRMPAVQHSIMPLKEALEAPEKQLILQALEALNWNRQETARVLDINRTTLYKKMKKYGLLFDEPVWAN